MITINKNASFEIDKEKSLLQLALYNNIEINHSCGGYGTCGTCRVFIDNHHQLPDRNPIEQEMASDRGFEDNERLSCQTLCTQALQIRTPGS